MKQYAPLYMMSLFLMVAGAILYFVMPAAFAGTLGIEQVEAALGSVNAKAGGDFSANLGVFFMIAGLVLWIVLFVHQLRNMNNTVKSRGMVSMASDGSNLPSWGEVWADTKIRMRRSLRKPGTASALAFAVAFLISGILGGPRIVYFTISASTLVVVFLNVLFPYD